MKYRAQRYPTRYPLKLMVGAVAYNTLVTSVSASGMCLQIDQDLAINQDVKLNCTTGAVAGKVMWARDGKVGVMFNRPLGRMELERVRYGLASSGHAGRTKIGFSELR